MDKLQFLKLITLQFKDQNLRKPVNKNEIFHDNLVMAEEY